MKKKYFTDEERKAARAEWNRKYYNTPYGRALHLLASYRRMDKRNGFGDVIDFDARWIVENIFAKKCAHCDCTDWRELGCNRKDNDLPHIKSNIECCCWKCNNELARPYVAERCSIPIAQHDKMTGELIVVWPSAYEIEKQLGYNHSAINRCCEGRYKQAYGFVWKIITKEEYEILRACLG